MNDNKDDIDKINEQIQSIMNGGKDDNETDDGERKVYVDRLDVHEEDGDTKKIDNINELEELEEEIEVSEETEVKEPIKDKDDVTKDEKVEIIEEPKEEKPQEKKRMSKKKKIIIVVCAIVAVLILIGIILFLVLSKDKKVEVDSDDKLSKSEQKEIINDYGDALKGIVALYYDKQKVLLEYKDAVKLVDIDYDVNCKEHEIYEDGEIYLNKCTIDKVSTKYTYGKKQEKKELEVSDDGIKVYVNKDNNQASFNEPKNKDKYEVYSFKIDGGYEYLTLLNEYGSDYVFYYDEKYNVQMINFKTGKKVLSPLSYSSVLPIKDGNTYNDIYIAVCINEKWGIYNIETRERVVSHIYDSIAPRLSIGISGPPLYAECLEYGKIAVCEGDKYGVINYQNGGVIIPTKYKSLLRSGNYLWAVDDNEVGHILDYSNTEYLNDGYDELYGFVDGKYALVNDNGSIKMIKLDGKVLYDYGELSLGKFNYAYGYNGAVFSFYKEDNNYEDCFEISYDSNTKKGETKDLMCGGIAKPILYLYPKKTTNVTVSFEHPEYLETTYPKFNGKWEVKANSNGELRDKNNKYYYGLYWDEKKIHKVDFSTGYYVEADDAIEFLEKKLDYIGLSEREANEFIMYWLPKLEKNGKSLVYFELTEERDSYNKINIDPKPDSLLRLVIHIKKVDSKVNIKKQSLTKFQRKGFVAVEWGGTTY